MKRDENNDNNLKRKLKKRQMDMIVIGGTVGSGLFFTSGNAISQAGPGGSVLAYFLMGIVVYFMMTSLIEMAAVLPVPGAYKEFPRRFIDPAWGFANGWVTWFGCAVTITAQITACVMLIKFWFPGTSSVLWAVVFLVLMLGLNLFSIGSFGECEYWLSGIKVVAVAAFIVVGTLMVVGVINGNSAGLSNWTMDGGPAGKAPFVGGTGAIIGAFLVAGFSFSNVEVVGISAAESENPARDVPKTIRSVFGTVFVFYVATLLIIGTLVPFTDPNLLKAGVDNIAASPFVIVFHTAGFKAAADIMNVVILTALLSTGNATMYVTVRTLFSMGQTGDAPRYFAKVNKKGIPVRAAVATALIGALAFFASILGDGMIYIACYSLAGVSTFLNWLSLSLSHYRFRKAYVAQGKRLEDLPYRAKFFPAGPIIAITMCTIVIFGANYWVFESFTWFNFITNYGLIPLFFILLFWYRKKFHTRIVPLAECSFILEEENN